MVKLPAGQPYPAVTGGKSRGKTELYVMIPEFSTEPQQDLEALRSQLDEEGSVPRVISTAPGSTATYSSMNPHQHLLS